MTSHREDVEAYVDGVTTGRIVTGRLARLAVWRYLDDLKHAKSRGFEFIEAKANDFLDFTPICCHTQGEWAGRPFIQEPWQKFIDWNLFGWRRIDDGTRRFRSDFEELARKSGKTSRCGPKCVYLSLMDDPLEEGGQGYCAATKEDQARLLFDELCRMIQRSGSLREYCQIYKKRIVFPRTQSYMQVLGSDSDSQDGFNPHFIIRDELHAWQERHRGLKEKLETGFGARRQPLTVTITTAGDDRSAIWIEEHDYAVKVLESVISGEIIDDTFFAFIAAIDWQESMCFRCRGPECPWCHGTGTIPKDDPFDEANWIKANPNIGITPKVDRLREAANKAKNSPAALNQFLRYHCNVRVAATERAIQPELWAACAGTLSDWNTATRVHGGFDLGRANDFAAAAMFAEFVEVDADGETFTRYEIRGRSFTSRIRDKNMQLPFIDRWIADELLDAADGDAVDFHAVEAWIVEQSALWGVRTWAFDKTFAHQMSLSLQNDRGLTIFPFTQAAHFYNEPIRRFLLLLTQTKITQDGRSVRLLTHDGNPVTAWQAGNLIIRRNGKDEWMPDKGASTNKIDEMVSNLMALSECLFAETEAATSAYTYGDLRA